MLRGPGLTPHKRIRAERSSNLSFQKLRGAGLTPHFHGERSSYLSGFFPLLASSFFFVARSILLWPTMYFRLLLPQVFLPGPAVRTRSGVEGIVKLVFGYPFSFLDPVDLDYD